MECSHFKNEIQLPQVEVIQYGKSLYKDINYEFIFLLNNLGHLTVIGRESDSGETVQLTEDERKIARDLGFIITNY